MKRLMFTLLILLSGSLLWAQTGNEPGNKRPTNNLDLTFLGNASLISFNYEKLFFAKSSSFVACNLGMGYNEELQICIFGCSHSPSNYFTLPHYVTVNLGKGKHFFEFGLGGTVIVGNTQQHYCLYPIAGYRLQPLKTGKLFFRVFGQLPVTGWENMDAMFSPVGFSLGISF